MKLTLLPTMILAVCTAPVVGAQSLTLFLPVDAREGQASSTQEFKTVGPQSAAAVFSLRSSSRFGDAYRSVLVDAEGNSIDVQWTPGATTSLPGHDDYRVLEITPQFLRLQFPPGLACEETGNDGFQCNDDGTALLTLVALAPLQRNDSLALPQDMPDGFAGPLSQEPVASAEGFVNPFMNIAAEDDALSDTEIADRTQRGRARAERLQQFQVERIPDDQVPPGMRVVRTPFGDRLVPIRE